MKSAAETNTHKKQSPPLSSFVRSGGPGEALQDRTGRMTAMLESDRRLRLRGRLPRGLCEMSMATSAGAFPTETLMVELTEWPSRRKVPAGPFDMDHTTYRMVVPTFRVFVNDDDRGLVWCNVPSPEDMAQGRVRATWCVRVEKPGRTEIRLEIPADEDRLRWGGVEELTVRKDERRLPPLGEKALAGRRHPRLFTDAGQLASLQARPDPIQQALLENMLAALDAGDDGTYLHRTAIAALAGRLTGRTRWIEHAVARTMELCERRIWGYHDTREIMGWNNDRDAGMRMFEVAAAYDWLYEHFDERQRSTIRTKLAYHCEIAAKVTLIQRGYWYPRAAEAHGQGFWFGFAAAAAALIGEDPRAEEWIDWIHGNMIDALRHTPADGITEWLVFNIQWLILTTMLLERLAGRKLRGPFPCLRNFGRNIVKFAGHSKALCPLLFYLAGRFNSRRMQADAIRACGLGAGARPPGGDAEPKLRGHRRRSDRVLHPLSILAYDPQIEPSSPTRPAPAVCSRNGTAICRSKDAGTRFDFCCGTPLTAQHHSAHNWIARQWYRPSHTGSFSWLVKGRVLVPATVPGYRQRTRDANLICVDGRGHPTEGRWLGYDIPLEKTARIEHFATGGGVTFCRADGSDAYTDESGVVRQIRSWAYFHDAGVLVMRDVVQVDRPRVLSWHVHAHEPWRQAGPLAFVVEERGATLTVRVLDTTIDGRSAAPREVLNAESEITQYVPVYSAGINSYKTLDWQPEVHQGRGPRTYHELSFRPVGPVARWELLTVMGSGEGPLDGAEAARIDGAVCVHLPKAGAATWAGGGTIAVEQLGLGVEADLLVRVGPADRPRRWLSFRTRGWRIGDAVTTLSEPADLLWRPDCSEPKAVAGGDPGA